MAKSDEYVYGEICSFYNEMMEMEEHGIKIGGSDIFKTTAKLFEKCKMTERMRHLVKDAAKQIIERVVLAVGEEGNFDFGEVTMLRAGTLQFRIDEFK